MIQRDFKLLILRNRSKIWPETKFHQGQFPSYSRTLPALMLRSADKLFIHSFICCAFVFSANQGSDGSSGKDVRPWMGHQFIAFTLSHAACKGEARLWGSRTNRCATMLSWLSNQAEIIATLSLGRGQRMSWPLKLSSGLFWRISFFLFWCWQSRLENIIEI